MNQGACTHERRSNLIRLGGFMKYTILLEKQKEGGYTAQCLEVSGAISQGETKKEAIKNVKEALELVLDTIKMEARKKEAVKVNVA